MRTHPTRGLSLIEALVWIAMFTAAMIAIVTSVLAFYRTSNFALQEATAITAAQRALDVMVRQIREASYASNGAYPIVSMATSSFAFYAEIDGDSGIERIRYYLDNRNLVRGVIEPTGDPASYAAAEATSSIAENVRNSTEGINLFSYTDKNGAAVSNFSLIGEPRFVTINISVDIDPNRTPTTTKLRSSAAIRNLIGE